MNGTTWKNMENKSMLPLDVTFNHSVKDGINSIGAGGKDQTAVKTR